MIKYCPSCGSELKPEYKFCLNCGVKIDSESQILTQTSKEENIYQPSQEKKSNIKAIIAIIAVIAIIVFIAIMFLIFFGQDQDDRFIGTWTVQSGGGSTFTGTVIFESNGNLKTGYQGIQLSIGKWSIDGNKVCLEYELVGYTYPKICSGYTFSNGGNSLTIYDPTGGGNNLLLTK